MTALILIGVFFGALLLVVGAFVFVNRRKLAAEDSVRTRLEGSGAASETRNIAILRTAEPSNILRDIRASDIPLLEELLTGRGVTRWLEKEIAQSASRQRPGELILFSLLTMLVGVTVGQFVGGGSMALLGGVLGAPVPLLVIQRRKRVRRQQLTVQLPDALDLLINALRAGYSLQAAIEFTGRETAAPLGPELTRFYDETRLGVDARTALLALQERVGTDDVKMFVTSLLLQRETGGNLTEILTNIGTLVRDRLAFKRQVETLTAEPKLSAYVLTALPFLVFAGIYMIMPEYVAPLINTSKGHAMVAYGLISMAVGFFAMMRIADTDL